MSTIVLIKNLKTHKKITQPFCDPVNKRVFPNQTQECYPKFEERERERESQMLIYKTQYLMGPSLSISESSQKNHSSILHCLLEFKSWSTTTITTNTILLNLVQILKKLIIVGG